MNNNNILYTSRGCKTQQNEQGELTAKASESCQKLEVFNWLMDVPADATYDIYEVRFKNTRKGYFKNVNNLPLKVGDIVAVEASPGHDTGIISLSGPLVALQMKRHNVDASRYEYRRIYRKAKPVDIEKWEEAVSLEHPVMIRTRQIVLRLKLNMKIGDVEFQGDKTKAIFYYIADERIDFRELIKILAEEFRIRIEMRQIGARQEAGRIGGIGPCGRELCCAQWMCNFVSVTTGAARYQEISLNPQKLAGQCSKLKCCLNFELDTYMDAYKHIPTVNHPLETANGLAYLMKTDVLKKLMYFSYDRNMPVNVTAVPAARVKELLALNRKNIKIESLASVSDQPAKEVPDFKSAVGEDSITRFDDKRGKKRRRSGRQRENGKVIPANNGSHTARNAEGSYQPPKNGEVAKENGQKRNRPFNKRNDRSRAKGKPSNGEAKP